MAKKSELDLSKEKLGRLQTEYAKFQEDLLSDSQTFAATKDRAVVELTPIITDRRPRINTIQAVLDWEMVVTNVQRYQVTVQAAKDQYQKSVESGQLDTEQASGAMGGLLAGGTLAAAGMAAPSAVVALASTFGVASTGTAIASLSGAAATNATLALIGGGSMAAGSTVLGLLGPLGWGVGGAVAVYALSKNAHKKKELLVKINEGIEELKQAISQGRKIQGTISQLQYLIDSNTRQLREISKSEDSQLIAASLKLSELLNTPVVND